MSRPAQIERQIERVKEIQAEFTGNNVPQDETAVVVEPKETTPPETVAPVVVDPPVAISKDDYDKLEQRYRTLQGMHTADINRFKAELAAATAAIQELEDKLLFTEKIKISQDLAPAKYVTKEDEEEYGASLDMMRRAAREEAELIAAKREEAYLARIAELENKVGHVQNTVVPTVEGITRKQQEQVKADFWNRINSEVPDWSIINEDAKFRAWLLAEDPVTGATRQQFLSEAERQYNAPRVIKFFQEWKRTAAGGQTPALRQNSQSELERLVAPGASKGGGTPVKAEPKTWTKAEISSFYKDVQTGKYIGKPDEKRKIEDDIFLAQKENRIT